MTGEVATEMALVRPHLIVDTRETIAGNCARVLSFDSLSTPTCYVCIEYQQKLHFLDDKLFTI